MVYRIWMAKLIKSNKGWESAVLLALILKIQTGPCKATLCFVTSTLGQLLTGSDSLNFLWPPSNVKDAQPRSLRSFDRCELESSIGVSEQLAPAVNIPLFSVMDGPHRKIKRATLCALATAEGSSKGHSYREPLSW